jgi:hypothetical protein
MVKLPAKEVEAFIIKHKNDGLQKKKKQKPIRSAGPKSETWFVQAKKEAETILHCVQRWYKAIRCGALDRLD